MPMLNLTDLVKIARSECYMLSLDIERKRGLNWQERQKLSLKTEKLLRKAVELLEDEQFKRIFYHDGEKWINSHDEKTPETD